MEILILSCGTGGGHNAAGRAVGEELTRRGHTVTYLDPYQLAGRHTAAHVGNTYIKLVQHSPLLFGLVYGLGQAYRRLPVHSPVYWLNGRMGPSMAAYLSEQHFDAVVMPHIYPAQILTHLKREGFPVPKTVLVATDYTCIPFMEETDCDLVITPSPELNGEFQSYGIPAEKLRPCGIPVSGGFRAPAARAEAKARLGLPPGKRVLLLSGGSIGVGKLEKTVRVLSGWLTKRHSYRLVVVCGSNRKIFEKLRAAYGQHPQIRLLESTDAMADYLAACDVFLSKPGGLSSTEAAASRTPLIHIAPIPGCETHNVRFFTQRGMSLFAGDPKRELLPALEKLLDPRLQREMQAAQARYVDPRAAERICDLVEGLQL